MKLMVTIEEKKVVEYDSLTAREKHIYDDGHRNGVGAGIIIGIAIIVVAIALSYFMNN